jgi:hypothetical protein
MFPFHLQSNSDSSNNVHSNTSLLSNSSSGPKLELYITILFYLPSLAQPITRKEHIYVDDTILIVVLICAMPTIIINKLLLVCRKIIIVLVVLIKLIRTTKRRSLDLPIARTKLADPLEFELSKFYCICIHDNSPFNYRHH